MNHNVKYLGKKELKTIVADDLAPVRAIRVIDWITKVPHNRIKDFEPIRFILKEVMKELDPEFEFFDLMDNRASTCSLDYNCFFENIPFLLEHNYADSL